MTKSVSVTFVGTGQDNGKLFTMTNSLEQGNLTLINARIDLVVAGSQSLVPKYVMIDFEGADSDTLIDNNPDSNFLIHHLRHNIVSVTQPAPDPPIVYNISDYEPMSSYAMGRAVGKQMSLRLMKPDGSMISSVELAFFSLEFQWSSI